MKKIIVFFIAVVIVFGTFGCGKKTKPEESAVKTENTHILENEDENEKKGGTVTVYSYKPDTLCPLISQNKANVRMLNIVYDGLFTVDKNMNINPCLASGYTSSNDNKKYTVTLKEDITFHDGSRLDAGDVVFSVNTIKENPQSIYSYNVSNVVSVRATDDYTVEFELIKPLVRFAALLDFPVIKSQNEAIDPLDFTPIGTGGFKFENRNEGNLYHLVKYDRWWGGEVLPDSVKVKLLPDKDTAMYAFSLGELSMCPAEGSEWGKFVDSQSAAYSEYAYGSFEFLGFNHMEKYLSLSEVRQAVSLALDRDLILKSGFMDFSEKAGFPVSEEWGLLEKTTVSKKNLNEARKILEENNWTIKNGVYQKTENRKTGILKFEILINEESYRKEQIAKEISSQLTNFGISTSIKKLPYEKYMEAVNDKRYDMFIGSIDFSPELDFSFLFGEGNILAVDDAELFYSQAEIQLAADSEDYMVRLGEFEKLFNQKNPFYGIGFEKLVMLYKKNIKGNYSPSKTDIYYGMEKVYIED